MASEQFPAFSNNTRPPRYDLARLSAQILQFGERKASKEKGRTSSHWVDPRTKLEYHHATWNGKGKKLQYHLLKAVDLATTYTLTEQPIDEVEPDLDNSSYYRYGSPYGGIIYYAPGLGYAPIDPGGNQPRIQQILLSSDMAHEALPVNFADREKIVCMKEVEQSLNEIAGHLTVTHLFQLERNDIKPLTEQARFMDPENPNSELAYRLFRSSMKTSFHVNDQSAFMNAFYDEIKSPQSVDEHTLGT